FKVESDYEALQDRLSTLPDKLSYDIMVPFGPLAFMPGRLVHTNEVTVLLGDNWFAKCSAKQAGGLVEHRKKRVRKMLDDLGKVMKNFESRAEFTEDLQKISGAAGNVVDIREITESGELEMKGKHRTAHKPHSKPKICAFEGNVDENGTDKKPNGDLKSEEDIWARLDELERQEQILGELSRISETRNAKAEGASSSEEEREDKKLNLDILQKDEKPNTQGNFQKDITDFESFKSQVNGPNHYSSDDEDDFAISENAVPTIYFSHTVEPKRVCIVKKTCHEAVFPNAVYSRHVGPGPGPPRILSLHDKILRTPGPTHGTLRRYVMKEASLAWCPPDLDLQEFTVTNSWNSSPAHGI
uniref:Protein phosphatase 1 regulatory subunit 19 n=1 Tax=Laticauda laticaudata TaxID=8630 RepID=A0A8C5SEK1_LATLA